MALLVKFNELFQNVCIEKMKDKRYFKVNNLLFENFRRMIYSSSSAFKESPEESKSYMAVLKHPGPYVNDFIFLL